MDRDIPLKAIHDSQAITGLGFDEDRRMLVVKFSGSDARYGYPNLSDEELSGLVDVLDHHESLGHFIATVIKPNHDHERVQF